MSSLFHLCRLFHLLGTRFQRILTKNDSTGTMIMAAAPLSSVTIVGGGTAGWMTAAALANHFKDKVKIRVIASSQIATVGVGEATIPTIRSFYQSLGLSDADIISATGGTVKMALAFRDWRGADSVFYHGFGGYGEDFGDVSFLNVFNRLRLEGDELDLDDYCLSTSLAKAGKFAMTGGNAPFYGAHFDFALHIDAGRYAAFLKTYAEARGVTYTDAKITQVNLDPDSGHIKTLDLDNGTEAGGNLFIDCSGFQGLLIHKALGVGFEDYGQWLFCDRAFAVQAESHTPPPPTIDVYAHDAGWQWTIPLQQRNGTGFVYASDHMRDDEAYDAFLKRIPGKLLLEPHQLKFRPGHRHKAWEKNCVAIGLSGGFIEPLESTSIALIQTGIEKLKQLFPASDFHPALQREYNDIFAAEYERVRDFVLFHYCAATREDTSFWKAVKAVTLPDSLTRKLTLYKERGHFVRYRWEMFHPQSWLAIYNGYRIYPDQVDPAAQAIPLNKARQRLKQMKDLIAQSVARAASHQDFIDYCNRTTQGKIHVRA